MPSLEKQSETAKIYLKKREELKALDVRMFLAEMERINAQLKEIEEKSEIVRQDLEKQVRILRQRRPNMKR